MLNLTKNEITQAVKLNLIKRAMPKPLPCSVNLFIDISGSFQDEWEEGLVAAVVRRVLGAAAQFDDDGNVPLFLFNTTVSPREVINFSQMPESLEQTDQWIKRVAAPIKWGGTKFAPVFKALVPTQEVVKTGGFFGFGAKSVTVTKESMVKAAEDPTLVYIITDGDADDYHEARALARELQDKNIYIMFINVSEMAQCAVKLSDEFGHVGHVFFKNIRKVSDAEIFDALMTEEFVDWRKKIG